ncbi:gamma-glutamyltransferase [bacterium]|nr:gamma-glutamyltransferase [bacterium]
MRHLRSFFAAAAVAVLLATVAAAGPARGQRAMVATAEPMATEAAVAVLRDGGTAADAAITAAVTLAVTEPYSSGLGGGGFVVGWLEGVDEAYALDCRETAPAGATDDMFLGSDGRADPALSRTGALSVAVPGLVRGLWELHRRHGRLPWPRLLGPAITAAREGFAVPELLAQRIASAERRGHLDPAARAVFCPDGEPLVRGDWLRQPDLARTLEAVAESGPDGFYSGPVARAIVDAVASGGGVLTARDLDDYRAVWRDPVRGRYRDHEIVGMPPPSSGGVHIVQMLNILEPFDLAAAGYGSAAAWHPLLEAMKFAFADRSRFLGDPDHVDVPVAMLVGAERAAEQRARIRHDRALDPLQIAGAPTEAGTEHTTHLSIVDPDGNAIAATLTINLSFGAGMIAPGTGVLLNDEMDDFAAQPGVPNAFGLVQGERNAVRPGRRPLSSMSPTIVLRDGAVEMVTGSPGGSRIITATVQTILHVVDFGMDAREAVTVPRVHHQWRPVTAYCEWYGMSPDTRAALERLGHRITPRSPMGNVQLILRDRETGGWQGASDPRGMGLAAGF